MIYCKFNPALTADSYSIGDKCLFYTRTDINSAEMREATTAEWNTYGGSFKKEDTYLTGKVSGLKFWQYAGVIIGMEDAGNNVKRLCVLDADHKVRKYECPLYTHKIFEKFTNAEAVPLSDPENPDIEIYPNGMCVSKTSGEVVKEPINDNRVAAMKGTIAVRWGSEEPISKTRSSKVSGLKADSGSGLKTDSGSSLKADTGSGLKTDNGSGLKSDSRSGLKADSGSGLKSDSGSNLKADSGSGLKTDTGSGLKADK